MKLITVIGNIVTITLVTFPVFETIRISANDREAEFLELQTLRQKVHEDYNYNFNVSMLREFVLNKVEMYEFVEYFNRTGEIPEWSESHKLKNPDLYEQLRFNGSIRNSLNTDDEMIEQLTLIQDLFFQDSPDVSLEDILRDYAEENLKDIISVENYLAIRILEKDYKQVELDNLVGWRIKRALYSLAIRQYSEKSPHRQWKLVCISNHLKSERDIDASEVSEIKLGKLRLCGSKRLFLEKPSESSSVEHVNPSSHWIIYKYIITDPKFVVYLEDVVKRNDEMLYFLLPQTRFKVVETSFDNTVERKVDYLKLKTVNNPATSKWLANAANMIETYKEKEDEYFFIEELEFLDDIEDEQEII